MIRILSDIHFGDRASAVVSLDSLAPLLEGVGELWLNGDTLDTRPGGPPGRMEERREHVLNFFLHQVPSVTYLTGNHDPDISDRHVAEFCEGRVFMTHGDILFKDIVPWSRDAALASTRLTRELDALSEASRNHLETRLAAYRRVAASLPLRHQAVDHSLKYTLGYIADTIWPPSRMLRIVRAWRDTPEYAATLLRKHRPRARCFVMGHTHRSGTWRTRGGITVLNTGSFCTPVGAAALDIGESRLILRKIERRRGEFRIGRTMAEIRVQDF
jgi:predicted phosphodiesterase